MQQTSDILKNDRLPVGCVVSDIHGSFTEVKVLGGDYDVHRELTITEDRTPCKHVRLADVHKRRKANKAASKQRKKN